MVKKRASRSDNSEAGTEDASRWKYLAFAALFTFPAFIYVFEGILSLSNTFRAAPRISGYVYIVFTVTAVVVAWMYFRTSFRGFNKYLAIILLPVLLFPSLQVYTCSPVVLVNKEIGTTFKLGSTASDILQYCGEYCLERFSKSLYSLSMVTPRVQLKVMPSEVVDLNLTTNSIMGGETLKMSRLFLIFSLRSVRGKVHSLSMITKVPFRSTKILEAMEKKQSFELTGRLVDIGTDLREMKANLERSKLFIRPVTFEPYRVEVNDDDEL